MTTKAGRRVKVTGDYFHGQVPDGAVYVGRAAPGLPASPYRNPYRVKVHGLEPALMLYLHHLVNTPGLVAAAADELTGRDLADWCPVPGPGQVDRCHGALLLTVLGPPVPAPDTCQWCGVEERTHYLRSTSVGSHAWTAPTQRLIRERMLIRRAQTLKGRS